MKCSTFFGRSLQSKDVTMLASACEFLSDVVFQDFPAEIFLQRSQIVKVIKLFMHAYVILYTCICRSVMSVILVVLLCSELFDMHNLGKKSSCLCE